MRPSSPTGHRPSRHHSVRSTAEERRAEIIAAAVRAFAVGGLHGTSTESIAEAVGVTQPYVFRLFGTKRDLFIEAVRDCFERTRIALEEAGVAAVVEAGAAPDARMRAALAGMGMAYWRLLDDRTLLLLQLQAYAASDDRAVRAAVREGFEAIVEMVRRTSGAPDEVLSMWLAQGMLWNVAAAMDLAHETAPWGSLCADFVARTGL